MNIVICRRTTVSSANKKFRTVPPKFEPEQNIQKASLPTFFGRKEIEPLGSNSKSIESYIRWYLVITI